ncbi:AraC family transcriptional regulator ligand-binding domain-containing protein [Pseudomonas sp. HK3]
MNRNENDLDNRPKKNYITVNEFKLMKRYFDEKGIKYPYIDTNLKYIPASTLIHAWESILNKNESILLPCKIGLHTHISDYGVIGSILSNCYTLGESLSRAIRYELLMTDLILISTEVGERYCKIIINDNKQFSQKEILPILLKYISGFISICRYVLNSFDHDKIEISKIELKFVPTKEDQVAMCNLLNTNIEFNCSNNALIIPTSILSLKTNNPDPELLNYSIYLAKNRMNEIKNGRYSEQLSHLLSKTEKPRRLKISVACDYFEISSSKLRRRLALEGTSYNEIIDTYLKQESKRLAKYKLTATKISEELGYSNLSSFSKAFKRWNGHTFDKFIKESID